MEIICNVCNIYSTNSFTDIGEHERKCKQSNICSAARYGKRARNRNETTIVQCKNTKKCSLITDHMDSTKGTENRIQIGNDTFPLQNCISTGPTASLSDYFLSQCLKI
jgi:hypothetical protein